MSYKIAIASGKGGTGKTTVSVNLFKALSAVCNNNIQLIDCDVEEPNAHLFLAEPNNKEQHAQYKITPQINTNKCKFCKKCVSYCEFNAISVIPTIKHAQIDTTLCHSCGACQIACSHNAIEEFPIPLGTVEAFKPEFGESFITGKLEIGSTMQTMMIGKTKKFTNEANFVTLYDSPPGTSCPVVETISDVDFIILVTEPTPFGMHDLKLMIELVEDIKRPFGIIVNKADMGNDNVFTYLTENNYELLGEISFDKNYAANYASGKLLENIPKEVANTYNNIAKNIVNKALG